MAHNEGARESSAVPFALLFVTHDVAWLWKVGLGTGNDLALLRAPDQAGLPPFVSELCDSAHEGTVVLGPDRCGLDQVVKSSTIRQDLVIVGVVATGGGSLGGQQYVI